MGPVVSRSLFFDVQVMTPLMGKYTLFARADLCYSTTRLRSYFVTIFAAHLCVCACTMGWKRSLRHLFHYSNLPANRFLILKTARKPIFLFGTLVNPNLKYIKYSRDHHIWDKLDTSYRQSCFINRQAGKCN